MDEVRKAIQEGQNVKVRPLAKVAGVSAAHIYAVLKRENPDGVSRIGRAIRVTPPLRSICNRTPTPILRDRQMRRPLIFAPAWSLIQSTS